MEMRDFKCNDATLSFMNVKRQQILLQEQFHLLCDVFDWTESTSDTPNVVQMSPIVIQRKMACIFDRQGINLFLLFRLTFLVHISILTFSIVQRLLCIFAETSFSNFRFNFRMAIDCSILW